MTRLPVAYLRPDAVAEPLFNRWYAWGYLIAPQTAAMFVAQAHLRLMRSFVSAPRVHAEALKNAALRGGAFLDCDASRVDDVRALADATERTSSDLLELAEGLRRLDELLAAHESGTSLEPLYERVPPALRGYVELVFDARHRATFRLFEALLYRSRYYDEARQSVGLSVEGECARPFVFSTPRLDAPGKLFLDVPFRDPALDALFRMRTRAGSVDAVAEALGVEGKEARSAFDAMFTAAPPAASAAPPPGPLRVRYLGHACVLIETPSCNVLVDPLVAPDGAGPGGRYGFADLPRRIDYVLLTHAHQDHVLLETLLQIRHRVGAVVVPEGSGGTLVDPSLKLILKQIGFSTCISLGPLDSLDLPGGKLTAIPFLGEHGDLDIRTKSAYAVTFSGKTVLLAADSNNLDPALYEHVARGLGPVDLLFLGMECDGAPFSWLYGPLFSRPVPRRIDETRRSNGSDCARGMRLVEALGPRRVAVYAMGQEPWCTFLTSIHYNEQSKPIVESDRLVSACRGRGIEAERVFGRADWALLHPFTRT